MINKDTQVCISMAAQAGNFGCSMHNASFRKLGLNFIYKSFSIPSDSLEEAIEGMKVFGFRGAGITMPHKINILKYVDTISPEVAAIGSTNTVINEGGVLTAYNTDSFSSYKVMRRCKNKKNIYILGNGGFSKAVQYSARKLFDNIRVITRKEWESISMIEDAVVFNCTPVKDIKVNESVDFIDCLVESRSGQELTILQASQQFKLYTGHEFPIDYIKENFSKILETNT